MSSADRKTFDVVIIGAGVAGVNAAYYLKTTRPDSSFIILESRDAIGGTWGFFKYPGIRSDSDMYSFAFPWHPWHGPLIGNGRSIHDYIRDAATSHGIDRHITFQHRVELATWSDAERQWTLRTSGETKLVTAKFVVFGTGLFDYDSKFRQPIPGIENFTGPIIHPQLWPDGLDYSGKKIVVIGSGATAVTLVPELSTRASHVTMLQRSPSYIVSFDNKHRLPWLPFRIRRIGWISFVILVYLCAEIIPDILKRVLCYTMDRNLPAKVPKDPDFRPRYHPWKQRVCVAADGDLFKSITQGKASVKTGTIRSITEKGISLDSGEIIEADMIVTATGYRARIGGGVHLIINDKKCQVSEKFMWKGSMLQDIPNAFFPIGYPVMTWTLGVEVSILWMIRLMGESERRGAMVVVPCIRPDGRAMGTQTFFNYSSTYIKVAEQRLPKLGDIHPWKNRQIYFWDSFMAKWGAIGKELEFR